MKAYGHDALGRLTFKDLPNLSPHEHDISYGYDNLGRLVSASDPYYQISHAYDALGRHVAESGNLFGTMASQYDPGGRRTRLTHPDGFFVTYEHLVTGETTHIRENGGLALATFGYDDLGRRTSLTRGNGTATSYAYDPVSRLQTLTQDVGGTASDLTLGFSYNPSSQIVSNTRSNDAYSFTGQASGTTVSTANGLNQLVQQGGASITYDGRGNLTNDGAGRTYGYTGENRLATSPGVELAHDPLGRLHYQVPGSRGYGYDGVDLARETVIGGGLVRRYVHGPGVDEPLVWYEGAGTGDRRYLHADERGSIVAVSDNAGNSIGTNKYDEYGLPAATNIGRFQYTGQKWLPELGLYDYKARMYDPRLPRFLQPDPIGYGDGMNPYIGMGGDPINKTDPSGMCEYGWTQTNIYKRNKDGSETLVGEESDSRRDYGWYGCSVEDILGSGGPGPRLATGGKPNAKPTRPRSQRVDRCVDKVTDDPGTSFGGKFEYDPQQALFASLVAYGKHSPGNAAGRSPFGGDITTPIAVFNAVNLITPGSFAVRAGNAGRPGYSVRVTTATGLMVGYDRFSGGMATQYLTAIFNIYVPAGASKNGRAKAQLVTAYPGCPK